MKNCIIFPHKIKDSFIGTAKRLWKKGWFKNLFCSEKLGIGVEEPTESLDVNGDVNIRGLLKTNGEEGTEGQVLTRIEDGIAWQDPTGGGPGIPIGGDGSILAIGEQGVGEPLPDGTFENKVAFYWYPKKVALRVGSPYMWRWNDEHIGENSIAIGNGTYAGNDAVAIGTLAHACGVSSVVIGTNCATGGSGVSIGCNATGHGNHIAIGETIRNERAYAISLGFLINNEAQGEEPYGAFCIGRMITAQSCLGAAIGVNIGILAEGSFVIGKGVSYGVNLVNNIPYSLMVGFNSTIPTLFVSGGNGPDTLGKVGIGTTEPESLLDVNGDIKSSGNLEIEGELKIKVYYQEDKPTLGADQRLAMWIDTDDNNRVYLLFRRAEEDQVAVELTAIE